MKEKITEKDIDSMMAFVAAVSDACKEPGKEYTFPCPICGKKARAIQAVYNGHRTGFCPSCRTHMAE